MEKQTKNIITRKFVEKELWFYNTADIRSSLVFCAGLSLVFVPMTLLMVYAVCSEVRSLWIKILLIILCAPIISAPLWINSISFFIAIAERKMLKKGEFDIVARELLYKCENTYHRHTLKMLNFDGFKGIAVSNVYYELSAKGDIFYIVHYRNKNIIKLFYYSKIYEYKE